MDPFASPAWEIMQVLAVLVSLVLHEVAHAVAANALGDPTAKNMGRITLNPVAHLDPVGSVALPLLLTLMGGPVLAFAKPVPYDPRNLRHPVRDEVLVALAGPACNVAQAIVGALAFRALDANMASIWQATPTAVFSASLVIRVFLFLYVTVNLMLAFFNLLPLPPLDGSSIVFPLLRGKGRVWYYQVQRYSLPVLMVLLYLIPTVLNVSPVSIYLNATAVPLADLLLGI